MKVKKINYKKIDPRSFYEDFLVSKKRRILGYIINEMLYDKENYKNKYKEIIKQIIFHEIYNISGNLKDIKTEEEQKKILDEYQEYTDYINDSILKFEFFIEYQDVKDFIEKLLIVYDFIFVVKSSIFNLLKYLESIAVDTEDNELLNWINEITSKYYKISNIIPFPSKKEEKKYIFSNNNPVTYTYIFHKNTFGGVKTIKNSDNIWNLLEKNNYFDTIKLVSINRNHNDNNKILEEIKLTLNDVKIIFEIHIDKRSSFFNLETIRIYLIKGETIKFAIKKDSLIKFRVISNEKSLDLSYTEFKKLKELQLEQLQSLEIFCSDKLEAEFSDKEKEKILDEITLNNYIIRKFNFEFENKMLNLPNKKRIDLFFDKQFKSFLELKYENNFLPILTLFKNQKYNDLSFSSKVTGYTRNEKNNNNVNCIEVKFDTYIDDNIRTYIDILIINEINNITVEVNNKISFSELENDEFLKNIEIKLLAKNKEDNIVKEIEKLENNKFSIKKDEKISKVLFILSGKPIFELDYLNEDFKDLFKNINFINYESLELNLMELDKEDV